MNSRERVCRSINFQEVDRVPFDLAGQETTLMEILKVNSLEKLYEVLGIDFWRLTPPAYCGSKRHVGDLEADYWGVPVSANEGDSSDLCPLKDVETIDEVERYHWPSANDFSYDHVEDEIKQHDDFFIIGGTWAPIFHNYTWLCGFENTLSNLILKPEVSHAILGKITDFWIEYTKNILDKGRGRIDLIYNCNDFGGQNGLLFSPETWREYFKPELKRFYESIKKYEAKVMQHSCGAIRPIIPDLIEIGADILDPIQVTAEGMDFESLAKEYNGKITLHGGVDTQHLLPKGTEAEVRRQVRKMISCFPGNAGYVLCGSQSYMDDIPVQNIIAIYDEGKK